MIERLVPVHTDGQDLLEASAEIAAELGQAGVRAKQEIVVA